MDRSCTSQGEKATYHATANRHRSIARLSLWHGRACLRLADSWLAAGAGSLAVTLARRLLLAYQMLRTARVAPVSEV